MSDDDLHQPLKLRPAGATPQWRAGALGGLLAGVVVLAAAAFVVVRGDRLGGEPHAVVRIDRQIVTGSTPVAAAPQQQREPVRSGPDGADRETAQEVEEASGVRVVRGRGGQAPGALIIRVPEQETPGRLAGIDRRLVERGRHGPLPKIDPLAGKPRDVYARPFEAGRARGRPVIAVVVTGLGIGASATADAIARLPGEVTFAFAPYGGDLEKHAARARDAGHELLLQVPMEPYGQAANEAGPHALLAEASETQNLDRLHWAMSRLSGYVGLTNYMGAKFSGVRPALKPVLDEVAQRGLIFVEDGASARSLVAEVASTSGLPTARGDIVLDGVDKPADIEAALARAETQARVNGRAIVFGPALPGTIDRLNRWVRSLDEKGFTLAPVSALVSRRNG